MIRIPNPSKAFLKALADAGVLTEPPANAQPAARAVTRVRRKARRWQRPKPAPAPPAADIHPIGVAIGMLIGLTILLLPIISLIFGKW